MARVLTEQQEKSLDKRFTYHPPKGDQPERYEGLRALARAFAMGVMAMVPDGREQAVALTHIETAVMWANAGVAREEGPERTTFHTDEDTRVDRTKEPKGPKLLRKKREKKQ